MILGNPLTAFVLFIADIVLIILIALVNGSKQNKSYTWEERNQIKEGIKSEPEELKKAPKPKTKKKSKVLKVVGRKENKTGANTHYLLNNGELVTRKKAVKMYKEGKLPDYHIIKVQGKEYLRDNPDTKEKNNIDNQKLIE